MTGAERTRAYRERLRQQQPKPKGAAAEVQRLRREIAALRDALAKAHADIAARMATANKAAKKAQQR